MNVGFVWKILMSNVIRVTAFMSKPRTERQQNMRLKTGRLALYFHCLDHSKESGQT